MKALCAWVLIQIYGVRGALRPPLGGSNMYWIRYQIWRISSRLYTWCGVPERWHKWYSNI